MVWIGRDIPLAPRTTLQVGGPANIFIEVHHEEELQPSLSQHDEGEESLVVLGGGSNVVIAEEGVSAPVVTLAMRGIHETERQEGVFVTAVAGESWDALVSYCVDQSLAGLECLSGIPGFVGAAPIQNIGAYGQEVADCMHSVRAYDRYQQQIVELPASFCQFSYRTSIFKKEYMHRYLILSVTFCLQRSSPAMPRYAELAKALAWCKSPTLHDVREAVLRLRRQKSMVIDATDPNSKSVGSFFLNPVLSAEEITRLQSIAPGVPTFAFAHNQTKVAAAWLIEQAGFAKGYKQGNVGISHNHSLAIVNYGGASAAEVIVLAKDIQREVFKAFSIWLYPEPNFYGFKGHPLAAEGVVARTLRNS